MNLYLSSYRLGNHPELLQKMGGNNKRAAVIANSRDHKPAADRQLGVERELSNLRALGYEPEELDLRDYFAKPESMNNTLKEFGLVWAIGGNSFLLRQAMLQSGFETALKSRLTDSDFVYAGYSAGVVVLGPTLEGLELVDSINVKPIGYELNLVWRGLGIIDYSIAPHFDSDHPESESINQVVNYFEEHGLPYKTLRDGEVIIVTESEESLIV